jgi:6-phosphogluconolactonase
MPYELIPFPTPAALAEDVARRLRERISSAAGSYRNSGFKQALSGGRIANELFRAVVHQERAGATASAWNEVHFFWADERCVPPDHADSNYRAASELMLHPLGVSPERIHRIEGELPPAEAARRAGEALRAHSPATASGMPVLDLVLLGMGEDGHIASLFPEAPSSVVESDQPFTDVIGPKPPPRRVTMTYSLLRAATEVWVLASGEGKENALRKSLKTGGITPLGVLLESRDSVLFSSLPLGSE